MFFHKTFFGLFSLAIFMTTLAGCGVATEATGDPFSGVSPQGEQMFAIYVENRNYYDAVVYWARGSSKERLCDVTGLTDYRLCSSEDIDKFISSGFFVIELVGPRVHCDSRESGLQISPGTEKIDVTVGHDPLLNHCTFFPY